MISETYKASETLKLQFWSAEEETSTGSGPRKCAYASCSPVCQKASLSLKRADDCKTLFSLHKVTKNNKIGFLFYRSFHPRGCSGIYKLPLQSNTDMQVSLSQLLKKEMSSKERDSSLMAHGIPARSSSIRLARTAPGSIRGVVCFGEGRRKHSFLTEECYSKLKEKKKTKPPNDEITQDWACSL